VQRVAGPEPAHDDTEQVTWTRIVLTMQFAMVGKSWPVEVKASWSVLPLSPR
jgi:hypothetical protein